MRQNVYLLRGALSITGHGQFTITFPRQLIDFIWQTSTNSLSDILESGADAASRTMTELSENARNTHRFEEIEFLLVADRLAELEKRHEACQLLKAYVRHFSETPEIRQKLAGYCK